jgi:serine/threonine-protein kinase HipA
LPTDFFSQPRRKSPKNSASFDLVTKVGDYFGLENDEMKIIAGEVAAVVSTWRGDAKRLGISSDEISRMTTAFEHDELKHALKY